LVPGDRLTTNDADGNTIVLWEDGEPCPPAGANFNIQQNIQRVNRLHQTARSMHGVTVASEELAKYFREVHKCEEVYFFPNTVVPEDYPQPRLQPHKKVRILWQGGMSHMIDWYPLRDALKTVAQRNPDVTFVIWGTVFPWVHSVIPAEQLELHQWVPYDAYKPLRSIIDVDINLCPLADNIFNRCKSAIKWYESTLTPSFEATLASDVAPYHGEIEDGVTGLLYSTPDEFVEKLEILIQNAELRRDLNKAAKTWVMENRHYSVTVPKLLEWYMMLRDQQAVALGA